MSDCKRGTQCDNATTASKEETQDNGLHDTKQLYPFAGLPPPSKVVRESMFSDPSRARDRGKCLAVHRAAVAHMVLMEEPAQWQVFSEDPDAWMWDLQPVFGLDLHKLR